MNVELPGGGALDEFWALVIVMTGITLISAVYMRRRGWL
jgi:Mg2+ and Co2+ transporter CorA